MNSNTPSHMLLLRPTSLPSGLRVRLRLPHGTDRAGLRALHDAVGIELDDVALSRLVRTDPRRTCAVVATTWIGGRETVVGFARARLGEQAELILVDDVAGPELVGLLDRALGERAAAVHRAA